MKALLPFALFLPFSIDGAINSNNDFQLWSIESVEKRFCSSALNFEAEQRFADNASDLHYYHFQAQYRYFIAPCIELAPAYRQTYVRPLESTRWRTIYNPLVDLTLWGYRSNVTMSNRIRVQYLIIDKLPNAFLYRNRTAYIASLRHSNSRLKALVGSEFFFLQRIGFVENRMELGQVYAFGRGSSAQLTYLLIHRKIEAKWRRINVLRLRLDLVF